MSETATTIIELEEPRIEGQDLCFRWSVTPETKLYRATEFRLTVPDGLSAQEIPRRLLWCLQFMCLHSHWALLRPCEIHLPVRLAPGEAETWRQLVLSYADTLDALGSKDHLPREVRILEQGAPLDGFRNGSESDDCVVAFSGGKDSLVQVGLARELGFRPLLVSTRSLQHGQPPEQSLYRHKAMEAMQSRHGLEVLEVVSDFRGCWNNRVPRRMGYPLSTNELSDTFLYTAGLVVCGYLRGIDRLFLASETELSENAVEDGVFLQHSHFMYSPLTQATLSALLAPFGLSLTSLSSALYASQTQELVILRYPEFAELQTSCWKFDETRKACSECAECKKLGWTALGAGGSPARMGVDMMRMIQAWVDYVPMKDRPREEQEKAKQQKPHAPNVQAGENSRTQQARSIYLVTEKKLESYLREEHADAFGDGRAQRAIEQLGPLQDGLRDRFPEMPGRTGYREGYLELLEPRLRRGLGKIFSDQFTPEAPARYEDNQRRLVEAIERITQPLKSGQQTRT